MNSDSLEIKLPQSGSLSNIHQIRLIRCFTFTMQITQGLRQSQTWTRWHHVIYMASHCAFCACMDTVARVVGFAINSKMYFSRQSTLQMLPSLMSLAVALMLRFQRRRHTNVAGNGGGMRTIKRVTDLLSNIFALVTVA